MNFPRLVDIGGNRFKLEETARGLLYTSDGLPTPYVFVPGLKSTEFNEWMVNGIFRARLSHTHQPAEFQRSVEHPYVLTDHMVKKGSIDSETASFAHAFWTSITIPR
jgi:hypothetical protein